jgi:predicted amidohydrolase
MKSEAILDVAVVQLCSQDDLSKNLQIVRTRILEAGEKGARLVVLPENLAYMGPEDGKRAVAESLDDPRAPISTTLSSAAREANVFVIGGGIPELSDDPLRPFNTCAVFNPQGELVARYRKIHLFDVDLPDGTRLLESASNSAGSEPVVVCVDGFIVGLSICYDLRFPELYRRLVDMGAEVLVMPAAFTLPTGKDHWHVLVRARAIESQCYALAPGQWGKHPKGRVTYGKSLIADPWGEVIAQCSEGEGICFATIQRSYLQRIRASLPSLKHRKLKL